MARQFTAGIHTFRIDLADRLAIKRVRSLAGINLDGFRRGLSPITEKTDRATMATVLYAALENQLAALDIDQKTFAAMLVANGGIIFERAQAALLREIVAALIPGGKRMFVPVALPGELR